MQLVEDAVLVAGLDLLHGVGAGLVDHLAEPAGREGAQLAGLVTGARREHPDHADVAPERDRLDAVLGLTAPA